MKTDSKWEKCVEFPRRETKTKKKYGKKFYKQTNISNRKVNTFSFVEHVVGLGVLAWDNTAIHIELDCVFFVHMGRFRSPYFFSMCVCVFELND